MPGYPEVMDALQEKEGRAINTRLLRAARLRSMPSTIAGLDLLVLDAPHLYDRPGGPYVDAAGARLARQLAALRGAEPGRRRHRRRRRSPATQPDLVHAHDWQAALTLAYMRYGQAVGVPSRDHHPQLAFQGQFGAGIFRELGLPARGHGARRRRILRRCRLPQGRPADGLGDHHGQPDLCRRKSARRNSAWASTA